MDQSALSAIGNAYADEILFAARLHPKTGCHQLSAEEKVRNRKGEPCPVCGTPIRRAGVLGYDAFFCPRCQATPQIRRPGVPW